MLERQHRFPIARSWLASAKVFVLWVLLTNRLAGAVNELDDVLKSFAGESNVMTVETAASNLIHTYRESPEAAGRIHAALAFRYSKEQPHDAGKIVGACKNALRYPLGNDDAWQIYKLLGDTLESTLANLRLREVDPVRKAALLAYMEGLRRVLDYSEPGLLEGATFFQWKTDDELLKAQLPNWLNVFKGSIIRLYRNVPFTNEISEEGATVITNITFLRELAAQAAQNSELKPRDAPPSMVSAPTFQNFQFSLNEYEIEGAYTWETFGLRGEVLGKHQKNFTVYVRGNAWQIDSTDSGNALVWRTDQAGSTNTTEIVNLRTIWKPASAGIDGSTNAKLKSLPSAYSSIVLSNRVPVTMSDDAAIPNLWLMFASGPFFNELKGNRLPPVFDPNASIMGDRSLLFEADWRLLSGSFPLPMSAVIYSDGMERFRTRQEPSTLRSRKHGGAYAGGFTNAIYTMKGVTNIGGIVFPSGFLFEEFTPGNRYGRYDVAVRRRAEASVTNARPVCTRKSLVPDVPSRVTVIDMRLVRANPSAESFTYLNTSGRWLSVGEAQSLFEFQTTSRREVDMTTRPGWGLAFVVAMVLPAVLLLLRRRRRAAQN